MIFSCASASEHIPSQGQKMMYIFITIRIQKQGSLQKYFGIFEAKLTDFRNYENQLMIDLKAATQCIF